MQVLLWAMSRLTEASTYAGLGGLLVSMFGIHLDNAVLSGLIQLLVAAASLAAIIIKDKEHV